MLDSVSAFMGSNRRSCYTARVEDSFTQIDGLVGRIIMVGQHSARTDYPHVIDSIVAKHLFRNFTSRHPVGQRNLGIFLKLTLQAALHQITDNCNAYKYNPDKHILFFLMVLNCQTNSLPKYTKRHKTTNMTGCFHVY